MVLRRFQYRDDATIDDYLGALELGVVQDELRSQETRITGAAGIQASGVVLDSDGSVHGLQRNVRQNAASKVELLFRLLRAQESKELWDLQVLDGESWSELEPGALINVKVRVSIPTIARALGTAQELGPLVQVMQAFADVDNEMAKQMTQLSSFAAQGGTDKLTVTAAADSNSSYRFLGKLGKSGLQVPYESLEGTRTLFGQIEHLIAPGEKELAIDMGGLGMMNREQRRAMAKDPKQSRDIFVEGPGAVVHVIAIYN